MLTALYIFVYLLVLIIRCEGIIALNNSKGRILGGNVAPEGKYPHMAAILYLGRQHCGGSILDQRWVLTAASCVKGKPPNEFTIRVGSNQWDSGGEHLGVLKYAIHEKYYPELHLHDIALLLVEPITFSSKVKPILLDSTFVTTNVYAFLSGWGELGPGDTVPKNLHHIILRTSFNPRYCIEKFQLCTFNGLTDGICDADFGGPLVTAANDVFKQIGVASAFFETCAGGYPDVFTRLSSYIEWIQSTCNYCASY